MIGYCWVFMLALLEIKIRRLLFSGIISPTKMVQTPDPPEFNNTPLISFQNEICFPLFINKFIEGIKNGFAFSDVKTLLWIWILYSFTFSETVFSHLSHPAWKLGKYNFLVSGFPIPFYIQSHLNGS
jgi:hypothetical protein